MSRQFEFSDLTEKRKERFYSKVDKETSTTGCWLWKGSKLPKGYGTVGFAINGCYKIIYAHRFSKFLETNSWGRPNDVCMHICDNPSCVNPSHLLFGTQADNMKDKVSKNRHKTKYVKISKECVNAILNKYKEDNNISYSRLCSIFNVSINTVGYILRKYQREQPNTDQQIETLISIIDNTPNNIVDMVIN